MFGPVTRRMRPLPSPDRSQSLAMKGSPERRRAASTTGWRPPSTTKARPSSTKGRVQSSSTASSAWEAATSRAARASATAEDGTFEEAEIPVVFHVISKATGNGGGNLSNERIDAQIDVLNDAFAGTGFSFALEEVTRSVKPEWFNLISTNGAGPRYFRGSGKEIRMKRALHQGDAETLNLYSAKLGQFLLGWAYLPMLRVFADKWVNDPQ